MKAKPKGFNTPCKPDKHHSVDMVTGICCHCHKKIINQMFTKEQIAELNKVVNKAVFDT